MTSLWTRADAHFNAAAHAFRARRYEASAVMYRVGLDIDPTRTSALLDLAKAYEHLGDWDAALGALGQVLAASPDHSIGVRRRDRVREERAVFTKLQASADGHPSGAASFHVRASEGLSAEVVECVHGALASAREEFANVLGPCPDRDVDVHVLTRRDDPPAGWPSWASAGATTERVVTLVPPPTMRCPGLLIALARHEYAHVLVHDMALGRCPRWLDESIAACLTKPYMDWERAEVALAASRDAALSLADLDRSPQDLKAAEVSLAYGQYAAIGELLLLEFGGRRISDVLWSLGTGVDTFQAITRAFDHKPEELIRRACC